MSDNEKKTHDLLPCPACDCGAGQPHRDGCEAERCSVCGCQRIAWAGCEGPDHLAGASTGEWPETGPTADEDEEPSTTEIEGIVDMLMSDAQVAIDVVGDFLQSRGVSTH